MLNLDIDGEIWRKSRSILLDMDANGGYIWKLIRIGNKVDVIKES